MWLTRLLSSSIRGKKLTESWLSNAKKGEFTKQNKNSWSFHFYVGGEENIKWITLPTKTVQKRVEFLAKEWVFFKWLYSKKEVILFHFLKIYFMFIFELFFCCCGVFKLAYRSPNLRPGVGFMTCHLPQPVKAPQVQTLVDSVDFKTPGPISDRSRQGSKLFHERFFVVVNDTYRIVDQK